MGSDFPLPMLAFVSIILKYNLYASVRLFDMTSR